MSGESTGGGSDAALTPPGAATAALVGAGAGAGGPPAAAESEDAVRISISAPKALALAPDGGLYVGAGSVIWRVLPDNTTYPLIGTALLSGGVTLGGTGTLSGGSISLKDSGNLTLETGGVAAGSTFLAGDTLVNGGGLLRNAFHPGAVTLYNGVTAVLAGSESREPLAVGNGVSGTVVYTDFGPFQNITALACRSGMLYAADAGRNAIYAVHAATTATGAADPASFNGAPAWSHIAGLPGTAGFADGTGAAALFDSPAGLALASDGTLYVADSLNSAIRTVTPGGTVATLVTTASLAAPAGLDISADGGTLYVADAGADVIQAITLHGALSQLPRSYFTAGATLYVGALQKDGGKPLVIPGDIGAPLLRLGGVTTIAGVSGSTGCTEGAGAGALLHLPGAVARADSGNLYVADSANHRILEITPAGTTRTLAGSPDGEPGFIDAAGTAARFYHPSAIVLDATGTLHIADRGNNAIRRISPAGDAVTTAQLTLATTIGTGTGAGDENTNPAANNGTGGGGTGGGGGGGGGDAPALPSLALLAVLLALRARRK
jgi:sugar lactone lactonase YvrE